MVAGVRDALARAELARRCRTLAARPRMSARRCAELERKAVLLVRGSRALTRESGVARHLEERYPGMGRMILAAQWFHREAALWAVAGSGQAPPACGVLFVAGGYPSPLGPLHEKAMAAAPCARFIYCDAGRKVSKVNESALGGPLVAVATARALDPEAVLGSPACAELLGRGPVSVGVVLSPDRWPPFLAPDAVAGYNALLPAGSTFCLSLVIPDGTPRGAAMIEELSLAGGPTWAYAREDVAGWIEGAGMKLHPYGVRSARSWERPWAEAYEAVPEVPGQVCTAVGIVS